MVIPSSEEDTQLDERRSGSSSVSRKFATSSTEKFRDIFYEQITDQEEKPSRGRKLLGRFPDYQGVSSQFYCQVES